MGSARMVLSGILRFFALVSAAVVAGVVGEYLHYASDAHAHANSIMVFAVSMAGISMVVSLALMWPFRFTFFAFPLDIALFISWMVVFGLCINLSGGINCSSVWYYQSWGYYYGGYYSYYPYYDATADGVGDSACGKWRAVLAWSFIAGMMFLGSGFLGTYAVCADVADRKAAARSIGPVTMVGAEEKDGGWHAQARKVGRAVGYNPGTKIENVAVRTTDMSAEPTTYEV